MMALFSLLLDTSNSSLLPPHLAESVLCLLSLNEQEKVISEVQELLSNFLQSMGESPLFVGIMQEQGENSASNSAVQIVVQCEEPPKRKGYELFFELITFLKDHTDYSFFANVMEKMNDLKDYFETKDADQFSIPDLAYFAVFVFGIFRLQVERVWYTKIVVPLNKEKATDPESEYEKDLRKVLASLKLKITYESKVSLLPSLVGLFFLKALNAEQIPDGTSFSIKNYAESWNKENKEDVLSTYLIELSTIEAHMDGWYSHDRIFELETNIDDMSGEELGHILNEFSKRKDVLDVSAYPLVMKKNRPAWCLRILTQKPEGVTSDLLRYTSTFGVRIQEISRHIGERRIRSEKISIGGKDWDIRVKEKILNGKVVGWKLEYDDLHQIAEQLSMPLWEVRREAEAQISQRRYKHER